MLLQTRRALRRGAPCLVRTVNCAINKTTPQAPHGHVCQGGCGGRLHGNCGSMFDDHETKRICSTCVTKAGKRKATPAEGAGAGPSKRPKKTKGGSREGSGSRARPDNNTKLEILKLMDAKVSYAQIADRFGCSVRFLATVRSDRKQIEAAAAAGGGSQKTARKGDFCGGELHKYTAGWNARVYRRREGG